MSPDADYIGLHFVLAGVGILISLLGLFLTISNWYAIIEWVHTIRNNPRYNRCDASVPLFGGLLLCVGLFFIRTGFGDVIPLWCIGLGLVIDFGCLPGLILQPFLYRWSERRKAAAKSAGKASCRRKS
jgi:hypothetical protein